jgi:hypothetical protein
MVETEELCALYNDEEEIEAFYPQLHWLILGLPVGHFEAIQLTNAVLRLVD